MVNTELAAGILDDCDLRACVLLLDDAGNMHAEDILDGRLQ